MSGIQVVDVAEAQVHEDPTLISRRVVRREHGAQAMSLNVTTLHQGYEDPEVRYPDHDEIVYVLRGTVELTVGGRTQRIGEGKAIFVPRGETYGYKVVEGPNEVIAVFSPAKY